MVLNIGKKKKLWYLPDGTTSEVYIPGSMSSPYDFKTPAGVFNAERFVEEQAAKLKVPTLNQPALNQPTPTFSTFEEFDKYLEDKLATQPKVMTPKKPIPAGVLISTGLGSAGRVVEQGGVRRLQPLASPFEVKPPMITTPAGNKVAYPMTDKELQSMTPAEKVAYTANPQRWLEDRDDWSKLRVGTDRLKIIAETFGFPTKLDTPLEQGQLLLAAASLIGGVEGITGTFAGMTAKRVAGMTLEVFIGINEKSVPQLAALLARFGKKAPELAARLKQMAQEGLAELKTAPERGALGKPEGKLPIEPTPAKAPEVTPKPSTPTTGEGQSVSSEIISQILSSAKTDRHIRFLLEQAGEYNTLDEWRNVYVRMYGGLKNQLGLESELTQLYAASRKAKPFTPTTEGVVTDPSRINEIKNSIAEGEMMLKSGKAVTGRKMSADELAAVQRSVDNSKARIGVGKTPEVTPPVTEMPPSTSVQTGLPGMPVKPAQVKFFEEVSGKTSQKVPLTEVPKKGTALEGQPSLLEKQAELEAAATEARSAEMNLQSLKETLANDPVANYKIPQQVRRVVTDKTGAKKEVISQRGASLESFISLREQSFPNYFTVKQARQLLGEGYDLSKYTAEGTKLYNKVPRDVALEKIAQDLNISADELADRVMANRANRAKIRVLESSSQTLADEANALQKEVDAIPPPTTEKLREVLGSEKVDKPILPLSEPTAAEITEMAVASPTGKIRYSRKQVDALSGMFGEYLDMPTTENAWNLTRELRRETRAGMADSLKARAQQLVADKGLSVEDAMNQSIRETMSGELPFMKSEYLDGITDELRDAFFAKVYYTLKDEPYEMMSTITALTNALTGKAIPRELGIKGGSAFTRLQRVFGDQPKALKAIERIADENKPLRDVVEGIYHEVGRPPVPIDQATADYLRNLSDTGSQATTGMIPPSEGRGLFSYDPTGKVGLTLAGEQLPLTAEEFVAIKSVPEKRTLATMLLDYRRQGLMSDDEFLTRVKGINWGKITPDEATKLGNELWIAKGKPGPTHYEAPINDAFKEVPLWPAPVRDSVVRVLKEIGMSPVDIGGFIKANKSSVDMSYWRQIMPLIPNHKVRFALSNVDAWKALFSQKSAEASWLRIIHDPQDTGLYTIYDALQAKQGRDFLRPLDLPKGTSQWKGVEEFGYLTGERLIPRLTAKIPWVKWSNRAFVSGTNSMSWGVFKDFYKAQLKIAEKYASGKLTFKPGETFDIARNMDAYATMLADWTGRASLGKLAPAAPMLGNIFYAPRFALGRAIGSRHLFSTNSYVRAEAWKDAAMFVGTIGGTLLLGNALGFWDVETDKRSADFMKIRIGNRHIDPWGGAQQFVVFFSRVFDLMTAPITGKQARGVSTITGAEYPLTAESLTENFVKSKQAPLAGLIREYLTGKTFGGEKVDVKDINQWIDRLAPMSIQDIVEAFQDDPSTAVSSGILSFFGFGVQSYTGDWNENLPKLGMPKYTDMTEPVYDWADAYSDTAPQFKGVDPATLTPKKGFDPKVKLIVETARSLDESSIIPNVKLISMNADPTKGRTFIAFHKIWQDRQKLVNAGDKAEWTDDKGITHKGEKALKEFDADERHNQAYMGNFSQSQKVLLTQYWSITDKNKQADFLKGLSEDDRISITGNLRDDWYIKHPEENARQALAGKCDILTQKAYDIAQKLIKDYDIPANAVAAYIPPANIAKSYFDRNDIVDKFGVNSWEDKLHKAENPDLVKWHNKVNPESTWDEIDTPIASLELKTIPLYHETYDKLTKEDNPDWIGNLDDTKKDNVIGSPTFGLTAREIARNKLNDTKIPGTDLTYRDMSHKIDAIEKGTNDKPIDSKIVDAYVAQKRLTPGSAEANLARVDDPDLDAFLTDKTIWAKKEGPGDDALEPLDQSRIPIWRLQAQDRKYTDTLELYKTKTLPDGTPNLDYKDDKKEDPVTGLTARETAVANLRKSNPTAVDDERRIEVYTVASNTAKATGTPFVSADPAFVEDWVDRGHTVDRYTAGSAEAKLWLVDHSTAFQWALDNKILTDDGKDWNVPVLRIDAQYRAQDDALDAILAKYPGSPKEQAAEVKAFLDKPENAEYKVASIQRDGYQLGLSDVTSWTEYYQLSEKGYYRDRYLLANPDFFKAVTDAQKAKGIKVWVTPDLAKVMPEAYDKLSEQYMDLFDKYENVQGPTTSRQIARERIFDENPDFEYAYYQRKGYELRFSEGLVEKYAQYAMLPDEGFAQERFLKENQDFYNEAKRLLKWKTVFEWDKIPSQQVEELYEQYKLLDTTKKRSDFRKTHPDLEKWLLLTGKVNATGQSSIDKQVEDILKRVKALY